MVSGFFLGAAGFAAPGFVASDFDCAGANCAGLDAAGFVPAGELEFAGGSVGGGDACDEVVLVGVATELAAGTATFSSGFFERSGDFASGGLEISGFGTTGFFWGGFELADAVVFEGSAGFVSAAGGFCWAAAELETAAG